MSYTSLEKAKTDLIEILREKSYQKKEVTLASGRKSNFYIDVKQTLLNAKGIDLVSMLMLDKLKPFQGQITGVGGMTMGADPMVSVVSFRSLDWNSPVNAFYIRKEPKGHGTNEWVEGLNNFSKDESVFILEDVVTTGGSSLKAAERAKQSGLNVLGVLTCVDRQEGGREAIEAAGLKFMWLVTKQEIEC